MGHGAVRACPAHPWPDRLGSTSRANGAACVRGYRMRADNPDSLSLPCPAASWERDRRQIPSTTTVRTPPEDGRVRLTAWMTHGVGNAHVRR